MNKELVIGVFGPQGSGKSYIDELLVTTHGAEKIKSCTSRTQKTTEEMKDYDFVSYEKFQKKIKDDEFLEYGCWEKDCYGTPKNTISQIVSRKKTPLLEIGHRGLIKIIQKHSNKYNFLVIGILPDSDQIYKEIFEKNINITFNWKNGSPVVKNQNDIEKLIKIYNKELYKRMKNRGRENENEIYKKIQRSEDRLKFILSDGATKNNFYIVHNKLYGYEIVKQQINKIVNNIL